VTRTRSTITAAAVELRLEILAERTVGTRKAFLHRLDRDA